jgi:hypothetical protein
VPASPRTSKSARTTASASPLTQPSAPGELRGKWTRRKLPWLTPSERNSLARDLRVQRGPLLGRESATSKGDVGSPHPDDMEVPTARWYNGTVRLPKLRSDGSTDRRCLREVVGSVSILTLRHVLLPEQVLRL